MRVLWVPDRASRVRECALVTSLGRFSPHGSVVEPALGDFELLLSAFACDPINEPVFECNPARPPAFKIAFERLRLAGSGKRRPLTFPNQCVEALKDIRVVLLPMKIFLPSTVREDQPHGSMSSRSLPPPSSNCLIASRRRSAFAGLERRCIVSSMAFQSAKI